MGNPFADAFNQLLGQAKADLLVPFNTASDNIITTPTTQNVIGQGTQFLASLAPLLPLLEGQGIKDIFIALKAGVNQAATASAVAAPTATPSAASPTVLPVV